MEVEKGNTDMGNWYIKVDEKPVLLFKVQDDGDTSWVYRLNGLPIHFRVKATDEFEYMNLDDYKKTVQEEYKEMVLAVLDMSLTEMKECFGSDGNVCLRKILENHPDPLGAYQRWKAKKDCAKEMTIEEIEAQLGYRIKVVGKEE